jgi:hypothetical protein
MASAPAPTELAGCSAQEAKSAFDAVLSAANLVCVATSLFVDVDAVVEACKIADVVKKNPFLRDVIIDSIAQREAAKRAGFSWAAGVDGGGPVGVGGALRDGGK